MCGGHSSKLRVAVAAVGSSDFENRARCYLAGPYRYQVPISRATESRKPVDPLLPVLAVLPLGGPGHANVNHLRRAEDLVVYRQGVEEAGECGPSVVEYVEGGARRLCIRVTGAGSL
jgi:hypothetical protein